jgi:hypothetical protein
MISRCECVDAETAQPEHKRNVVPCHPFIGMKVTVIGDAMLDIYDFCSTAESKEIPSEVPGRRLIIRTACACAEKTPATARGIPLP